MPHTLTKTVYKFDELDERARDRAREWWRQCEDSDFDTDYVYEDAATIGALMGIDLRQRPVKLLGGGTRMEPTIWWSGFSSQGDGACFEGNYRYAKGSAHAVRDHAPLDTKLHAIVDALAAVQRRHFYRISANVRHRGHYYHEHCTEITVVNDVTGDEIALDDDNAICEALRDFMRWIYRQLEAEYEYCMSDENVDESIRINEYEFDEDGGLA